MFLKYSAKGTLPVPSAHPWAFFRISTCYKPEENGLRFERLVIVWEDILCGGRIQGKNEDGKRLDSLKKGSGLFVFI